MTDADLGAVALAITTETHSDQKSAFMTTLDDTPLLEILHSPTAIPTDIPAIDLQLSLIRQPLALKPTVLPAWHK